jgi:hypothetical protein
MKMTIITDVHGNVLGAVRGHSLTEKKAMEAQRVVRARPLHLIEVDDDLCTVDDVDEFQQRLRHHLQQHQQQQP